MPSPNKTTRSRFTRWWIAVSLAALVLRIGLIPISPKYGYWGDHDDFVRWGIQAADNGPLSLYDHPPLRRDITVWDKHHNRWIRFQRKMDRLCNYPPASVYLLWASGELFTALTDDRLINTTTSRAVFAFWAILADFLLAWGCASLVCCRCSFNGLQRAGPSPAPATPKDYSASRWTYAIVLFAPPFWWDSVVWGQMDTVVLAPAVWMLRAMVGHRWLYAGLLYGLTAALKPQAILFVPVWALAVVITRPFWKPVASLFIAAATLLVITLPFTLHGGWMWLHSSYVENLLDAYALTTLKAFNIWYLDLLITDSTDATLPWLGLAKDTWGKAFLLVALAAGFIWMIARWRRDPRALILWTTLAILFFVMLPTRVHERYLVLVIPFLVVSAMLWSRFWPGLLMLLVVATAQVTWPVWLETAPGRWPAIEARITQRHNIAVASTPPAKRNTLPTLDQVLNKARKSYRAARAKTLGYEWLFTLLALAATLATITATLSLKPPPPPNPKP